MRVQTLQNVWLRKREGERFEKREKMGGIVRMLVRVSPEKEGKCFERNFVALNPLLKFGLTPS